MKSHRGKPITYKKRETDQLAYYDGELLAVLHHHRNRWHVVVYGDTVPPAVLGVDGFNSRFHAVEYALKARGLWEVDLGMSILSMTASQRKAWGHSQAVHEAAMALEEAGGDPEAVAFLITRSDVLADGVTDSMNKALHEFAEEKEDPDMLKHLRDYKFLRSSTNAKKRS